MFAQWLYGGSQGQRFDDLVGLGAWCCLGCKLSVLCLQGLQIRFLKAWPEQIQVHPGDHLDFHR